MSQYFVTQMGKTVGPWGLEQIYSEIKNGNLLLSDYIFHPEAQEWQVILISPLIEDTHKNVEIRKKPMTSKESFSSQSWEEADWFIFKDSKQQGPFSYLEMINLLQKKKISDSDYVWSASLSTWSKVFELPAFSADQVKKLAQSDGLEFQSVFFRRQFQRVRFETSVFVHNSRKLWKASTEELSAGGCSVTLPMTELEPGDRVIIHFPNQPSGQVPAFNALCSIVSKKVISTGQHKIGVKFEALNQDIQLGLRLFTERAAA